MARKKNKQTRDVLFTVTVPPREAFTATVANWLTLSAHPRALVRPPVHATARPLSHSAHRSLTHVPPRLVALPRADLGPGGNADGGASCDAATGDGCLHQNCTGGAMGYIDTAILGPLHMHRHGASGEFCDGKYQCHKPFDANGFFGCLPTVSCLASLPPSQKNLPKKESQTGCGGRGLGVCCPPFSFSPLFFPPA